MRVITQQYKVLIDVLDNQHTRDMSKVLEEALQSGLLPEDGVALVSIEKEPSNEDNQPHDS